MTTRRHLWVAGFGLLSVLLASAAHAQPAPPPAQPVPGSSPAGGRADPDSEEPEHVPAPGAESHDGFYLRMQLGPGYTRMSTNTMMSDVSLAGFGDSFGIALGGALKSHLILYGTLIGSTARMPTGKLHGPLSLSAASDGMLVGTVGLGGFGGAGMVGAGAGVAYYLDSNVFFAGSLLGSRLFVDDTDGDMVARSEWGVTAEGLVGKEWWLSDNWGLGVSGQLLLGAMEDHPYSNESVPLWRLTAFSLLLSATYN
jgi:hypothetical protein